MITIYRNYTVTVNDSTAPYAPNDNLELLLYEGELEIKVNPNTGKKAVFNYGTTIPATPVYLSDNVTAATAVSYFERTGLSDRPGEYDFLNINLNTPDTASEMGECTYSVVARDLAYDPSDPFDTAKIIISNTDISDVNVKQLVKNAVGTATDIASNVLIAGGTVIFEKYETSVTNDYENLYLKLTNLPTTITNLTETVTSAPTWATTTKLTARFNVNYTDSAEGYVFRWENVPCYEMSDNSWVIHLTNDQYSTYRTFEFSNSGPTVMLDSLVDDLTVTCNILENNVYIRRFDTNPVITNYVTAFEQPIIHTHYAMTVPIVGIGNWSYADASTTPYYNLDVSGVRGFRLNILGNDNIISDSSQTVLTNGNTIVTSDGGNFNVNSYGFSSMNIGAAGYFLKYDTNVGIDFNTKVTILGSVDTYIEVADGTYKKYVDGRFVESIDGSSVTYSYDLDALHIFSIIQSASSIALNAYDTTKIYLTNATSYVANDVAEYPRIRLTSAGVYEEASAYTYLHTAVDDIYGYVENSSTAIKALSFVKDTSVKFGWDTNDSTSSKYIVATSGNFSIVNGNTAFFSKMMYFDSSSLTIGHKFKTSDYTIPITTYSTSSIVTSGSASTYISTTSSDQIYMNVSFGGTSKRMVSLDGTNLKFGYYVTDPSTGIYANITSSAYTIVYQNVNKLTCSSSDNVLYYNSTNYLTQASDSFSVNVQNNNYLVLNSTHSNLNHLTTVLLTTNNSVTPINTAGLYYNNPVSGFKLPYTEIAPTEYDLQSLPNGSMLVWGESSFGCILVKVKDRIAVFSTTAYLN